MKCGECIYWIENGITKTKSIGDCTRFPEPIIGKNKDSWCGEFKCKCRKYSDVHAIQCEECGAVSVKDDDLGIFEEYVKA